MRKTVLLLLFATAILAGKAQIRKTDSSALKNPSLIKKNLPVPEAKTATGNTPGKPASTQLPSKLSTPGAATTQQKSSGTDTPPESGTVDNTQYIITGAIVTIKTGNDSKEYPSKVKVYLFPPAAATYTYTYALGQLNISNAMNVNSSTEIGLTPLNQQKIPWPVYYSPGYNGTNKPSSPYTAGSHNWMLADLQKQGLRLLITYRPNIALDAWEIKQVTVKLKVEKADGSPHPTMNNKTIAFTISTPMLGVPTGLALVCEADKNLEPTTNYLTKDILID
jgi:hypothetical protein